MGSWNETCFISNLPIRYGDKVRYFLITKSYSHVVEASGCCYPYDYWFPRTIGLEAKYADYGTVKYIGPKEYLNFILNQFKDDLVELDQGENKYHEPATKADGMTFDDLQSWLHDNRVFIKDVATGVAYGADYKQPIPVGCIMCHEDVYQSLIYQFNKQYKSWALNKETIDKEFKSHLDDFKLRQNSSHFEMNVLLLETKMHNLIGFVPDHVHGVNSMVRLACELISNGYTTRHKLIRNIINDTCNLSKLQTSLGLMRKIWHPCCGKGSQHQEVKLYKALNGCMTRYLNKMSKE